MDLVRLVQMQERNCGVYSIKEERVMRALPIWSELFSSMNAHLHSAFRTIRNEIKCVFEYGQWTCTVTRDDWTHFHGVGVTAEDATLSALRLANDAEINAGWYQLITYGRCGNTISDRREHHTPHSLSYRLANSVDKSGLEFHVIFKNRYGREKVAFCSRRRLSELGLVKFQEEMRLFFTP